MSVTLHNPLLSGFYPDPSICRVGDDFYMVTSSPFSTAGIWRIGSRSGMCWIGLSSCPWIRMRSPEAFLRRRSVIMKAFFT